MYTIIIVEKIIDVPPIEYRNGSKHINYAFLYGVYKMN